MTQNNLITIVTMWNKVNELSRKKPTTTADSDQAWNPPGHHPPLSDDERIGVQRAPSQRGKASPVQARSLQNLHCGSTCCGAVSVEREMGNRHNRHMSKHVHSLPLWHTIPST